jgi:hypothetical protein
VPWANRETEFESENANAKMKNAAAIFHLAEIRTTCFIATPSLVLFHSREDKGIASRLAAPFPDRPTSQDSPQSVTQLKWTTECVTVTECLKLRKVMSRQPPH